MFVLSVFLSAVHHRTRSAHTVMSVVVSVVLAHHFFNLALCQMTLHALVLTIEFVLVRLCPCTVCATLCFVIVLAVHCRAYSLAATEVLVSFCSTISCYCTYDCHRHDHH